MSKTSVGDVRSHAGDEPLTMLTAYDAPIARQVDRAGVDMILVGDSAAHNHHGYDDTLPLTMAEALSNTAAVVRGVEEALVIADMPFLSYGTDLATGVENAGRFLKEGGADAVKLETAPRGGVTVDLVDRLTELGIPVQGHVGLTPQRVNEMGGPVVQGRDGPDSEEAEDLVASARDLEDAGAFSIVVEGTTEAVARQITEAVDVPTIGIGAGRYVDGQVLVITDVLGLSPSGYSLSKQYADLDSEIRSAASAFVDDVRSGGFPGEENVYEPVDEE